MNLYETLGVRVEATQEEIRDAWRRLSSLHHPDREHGNAKKQAAINEAYEVLSDAERREHYNITDERKFPTPKEAKIRDRMCSAFHASMMTMTDDPVQEARSRLMSDLVEKITLGQNIRNTLDIVTKRRDKLRRKDGGDNFLMNVAITLVEGVTKDLAANDQVVEEITAAIALIDGYEFEADAWVTDIGPGGKPWMIGGGTGSSTTGTTF